MQPCELCLPLCVMLSGITVDRLLESTVSGEIRLFIAIDSEGIAGYFRWCCLGDVADRCLHNGGRRFGEETVVLRISHDEWSYLTDTDGKEFSGHVSG